MRSIAYFSFVALFLLAANSPAAEIKVDAFKNPVAAGKDSIGKGQKSYLKNCAICHGTKGDGKGPSAESFEVPPWSFTDDTLSYYSDGFLFQKIKNGGEWYEMPPFGLILKEREIWDLINYLRSLEKKP